MNTNKKINRIYESKAFIAILSLLASLAIWLYVTSVDAELIKQTFRGVKVEFVGEETLRETKNMVITDVNTSTVSVYITGPRRIVGTLASDDLKAVIDLSQISRSSYVSLPYSIVFPDGTDTSRISVTSKTPETISFVASSQTSKTIQVRGSFDGSLAEGYIAEAPVFEPSTITISGAESLLKDVAYAWVSFGEDGVNTTYETDTGFTLMNSSGDPCQTTGISISDNIINAKLPVLTMKQIKLDINPIYGAGATDENTVIKIEPSSITLAGDSAILDGMNKIVLDTIDLKSFTSTFTDEYVIPLDNSLKNMTGANSAKVTIQLMGLATKTFSVSNLSCINVGDEHTAEILSESITVLLRGKEDELALIKDGNIRAVADLADFGESTGTFMAPVKIYIDGFTEIGPLSDNQISVEIRRES